MSRIAQQATKRPKPKQQQRRAPEPKPLLPQHALPEPYSRLLPLGNQDAVPVYEAVAEEIRRGNVAAGVETLQRMTLDETWYDYNDDAFPKFDDPRTWTRLHAVRVLEQLGEATSTAVEPLLSLLDDDDDWLREEIPFFYAAVGRAAIEPLTALLMNQDEETFARAGASESLAEMGEKYTELRGEIVPILEQAMVNETEDETVTAFVICSLLDLGASESLPLIERAYEEDRVDLSVVQLPDVQEHFGLPVTASYRSLRGEDEQEETVSEFDEDVEWSEEFASLQPAEAPPAEEEPARQPYVAELKVGRNESCPCGSGKKYKKCCGAA